MNLNKPRFVVGVCPQGVLFCGCGGGCPPFLRVASQRSVPLLILGFQVGAVEAVAPPPAV